jgi:hypothetical protein
MVGFDPTTCHMQWVFDAIGEATESHRWPLHGYFCHVSGRFQYPIFQAPFFLEVADDGSSSWSSLDILQDDGPSCFDVTGK